MQRRTFLKRGLFGGALLAVGGGGLAMWPSTSRYKATKPTQVLDATRFNILASIAARVVTAPGADPVTITETIDAALARAAPEAQKDIQDVLGLLENALVGGLLDFRFAPFTSLDAAGQDAVLANWRDSRLTLRRGAYKALKNLCVTSFYRKPEAFAHCGYPGAPDAAAVQQAMDAMQPTDAIPPTDATVTP